MEISKLLKQYEEIEFDSMEDETGRKEIVESVEEESELGLFIQTTGSLYNKYLSKQIEKDLKIEWDALVKEGAKLYKKEISKYDSDAPQKFSDADLKAAKEYIQDYYADQLSPQQLKDTRRKYVALTVKTRKNESTVDTTKNFKPIKFIKAKYKKLKPNTKLFKEDFNEIKTQVDSAIKTWIKKNNWGKDYIEIFTDYRDELDENSINKILEHPDRAYEIIDNLYFDNDYFGDDEYAYAFEQLDLDKDLKEKYEDEIKEYFRDRIGIRADYSHFLRDVRIDILIGEQVPNTYIFEDGKLVDVSDAVKFFIEKQGHTVQEFLDYYNSLPDFTKGTGKEGYDSATFFGSLVSEVDNAYRDYWYQPIIMGYIDLETYVKNYDAKQIEVPDNAVCGLTDRANGACSNLGIVLEKSFIIDKDKDDFALHYYHGYEYNVDDICGLVSECWDKAELRLIGGAQKSESFKKFRKEISKKLNEKVAEKLNFKLGTADVEVTNLTDDDITAADVKNAIEKENPQIFFNDIDSYHYIMDFSFEKDGKKYWVESKHIEGDFSKFELNVYKGFSESIVSSLLKDLKLTEGLVVRKMVESDVYTLDSKVKDFYIKEYPKDELGKEIPENLTFEAVYNNVGDIYDLLGSAADSIIRERVFEKLAEIKNVDYDVIYYKWLSCCESIKEDLKEKSIKFDKAVYKKIKPTKFEIDKNGKKAVKESAEDKTVNFMNKNFSYTCKKNGDEVVLEIGKNELVDNEGNDCSIIVEYDGEEFVYLKRYNGYVGEEFDELLEDSDFKDQYSKGDLQNLRNAVYDELDTEELKEDIDDNPRHIYGTKTKDSIPVALKTTYYPTWNKEEIVKVFDNEEDALDYAEMRGNAIKADYLNNTKTAEEYGIVSWVTPQELDYIKEHNCFPQEDDEYEFPAYKVEINKKGYGIVNDENVFEFDDEEDAKARYDELKKNLKPNQFVTLSKHMDMTGDDAYEIVLDSQLDESLNESFTKTYELPATFDKYGLNDLVSYAGLSKEQYEANLPEIIDYSKRPYKDRYDSAVGIITEFDPEVDDKPSFRLRFNGWINQNPDDKGEIKLVNVDSSIVKRVLEFIHRYKNALNGVDLDYIKEQIKLKQLKENESVNLSPIIVFDKRENKYACFVTENGGAVKYTDTKEEAEQFLIDKYGVKKEEIVLEESRADKIRKGIHKRVVRESKADDEKTAEKLIKELFGKIGDKKGQYKLDYNLGQASVVQVVNDNGGIQRVLIAKNVNDLVDKLAEIKSYIKYKNITLSEALEKVKGAIINENGAGDFKYHVGDMIKMTTKAVREGRKLFGNAFTKIEGEVIACNKGNDSLNLPNTYTVKMKDGSEESVAETLVEYWGTKRKIKEDANSHYEQRESGLVQAGRYLEAIFDADNYENLARVQVLIYQNKDGYSNRYPYGFEVNLKTESYGTEDREEGYTATAEECVELAVKGLKEIDNRHELDILLDYSPIYPSKADIEFLKDNGTDGGNGKLNEVKKETAVEPSVQKQIKSLLADITAETEEEKEEADKLADEATKSNQKLKKWKKSKGLDKKDESLNEDITKKERPDNYYKFYKIQAPIVQEVWDDYEHGLKTKEQTLQRYEEFLYDTNIDERYLIWMLGKDKWDHLHNISTGTELDEYDLDESLDGDIVTAIDIPLVTEKLYNRLVNVLCGTIQSKNRNYEQQENVLNFLQKIEDRIPLGCEFHTDLEDYDCFTTDEINAIKKIVRDERVNESLNEEVVAKFDNGKHEIVKCDKGYYNRYNIKNGKARFTTKCVESLPTALSALKKRFPNAEEMK